MAADIRDGLSANSPQELRKFGWTVGGVFIGVFGLALPLLFSRPIPRWPYWVGIPLVALGTLFPVALKPVHWIWMKIAHVLGWINTRVLLSVLFFVLLTPISLVLRLLKKVPLQLSWERDRPSYWSENPSRSVKFERPF